MTEETTPKAALRRVTIVNIKRTKNVEIPISECGLVVLEGANKQGKTSTLDAIALALCGASVRDGNGTAGFINDEATEIDGMRKNTVAMIRIECDDGTSIERRWTKATGSKGGVLEIKYPDGNIVSKEGDLAEWFRKEAIRPSPMGSMSERQRLEHTLKSLEMTNPGLAEAFEESKRLLAEAQSQKETAYQEKEQARRVAKEAQQFPGIGTQEKSLAEILSEQEAAVAHNAKCEAAERKLEQAIEAVADAHDAAVAAHNATGERLKSEVDTKAAALERASNSFDSCTQAIDRTTLQIKQLEQQRELQMSERDKAANERDEAFKCHGAAEKALAEFKPIDPKKAACMAPKELQDAAEEAKAEAGGMVYIDMTEIKQKSTQLEEFNRQARANKQAEDYGAEYERKLAEWHARENDMVAQMKAQAKLVADADVPLNGIGIDPETLKVTFNNHPWEDMSGMQRIFVELSIASLFQPNARFVMVDGLEAMDAHNLGQLHKWACHRNLQVLGTQVRDTPTQSEDNDGILRAWIEDGTCVAGDSE